MRDEVGLFQAGPRYLQSSILSDLSLRNREGRGHGAEELVVQVCWLAELRAVQEVHLAICASAKTSASRLGTSRASFGCQGELLAWFQVKCQLCPTACGWCLALIRSILHKWQAGAARGFRAAVPTVRPACAFECAL
jgi:hypothetical protein